MRAAICSLFGLQSGQGRQLPNNAQQHDALAMEAAESSQDDDSGEAMPGWLLALPGPAQREVVAQLQLVGDRRRLRLACKAAAALVDSCAVRLQPSIHDLRDGGLELQRRFPGVTRLYVLGEHEQLQPHEQLAPWTAITSLTLEACTLQPHLHFLSSFQTWSTIDTLQANGREVVIRSPPPCQQLPRLASLQLTYHQLLIEQHLRALTALTATITAEPREGGWAALTGMTALRSLSVFDWVNEGSLAAELMVCDMRGMTALTRLHWQDAGQVDDDYQRIVPTTVLLLPTSLVHLHLERLPDTAPALPHLTSLTLTQQQVKQSELAWLAANSSSLARLEVPQLIISQECDRAPLLALTQLISHSVHDMAVGEDAANVRFANIFPQLRALTLEGVIAYELQSMRGSEPLTPGAFWFQDLTMLTQLDLGSDSVFDANGLRLQLQHFEALAALPALSTLRLDVCCVHVQGVQLLTQLRRLKWVWGWEPLAFGEHFGLAGIESMFHDCTPPPQLRSATYTCLNRGDYTQQGEDDALCIVDAAISWFARAPALADVSLAVRSLVPIATPERLAALAGIPNIKRIAFDCVDRVSSIVVPDASWPLAQELIGRGLEVVFFEK